MVTARVLWGNRVSTLPPAPLSRMSLCVRLNPPHVLMRLYVLTLEHRKTSNTVNGMSAAINSASSAHPDLALITRLEAFESRCIADQSRPVDARILPGDMGAQCLDPLEVGRVGPVEEGRKF